VVETSVLEAVTEEIRAVVELCDLDIEASNKA
jgi:hypothetical protein